jgi:putative chitinase
VILLEQLRQICPSNKQPEELLEVLNRILPEYGIDTSKREAAFLAQASHESAQFNTMVENLNYSAAGLCKVWPKRFASVAAAYPYHRNPEKIGNKVYADRMGNGSEGSGDGYMYRGRGCIQTTGKENYQELADCLDLTLEETVSYCETLEGAITSGAFFWENNSLNQYADSGNFLTLTKRINGKTVGLADRQSQYNLALRLLGA